MEFRDELQAEIARASEAMGVEAFRGLGGDSVSEPLLGAVPDGPTLFSLLVEVLGVVAGEVQQLGYLEAHDGDLGERLDLMAELRGDLINLGAACLRMDAGLWQTARSLPVVKIARALEDEGS